MKKVCIALDYSPAGEKVAETGYLYAKALGAKIALAHVVSDTVYYDMDFSPIMGYTGAPTSVKFQLDEDFKREAENFLSASKVHLGDKNIETVVLQGETATTLLKYAKEWDADLLVIGTHSHSGLENLMMGNTAVKVVKHAAIPLLVVPVK